MNRTIHIYINTHIIIIIIRKAGMPKSRASVLLGLLLSLGKEMGLHLGRGIKK